MASPGSGSPFRTWKQFLYIGGLLLFVLFLAGCGERVDWEALQRQASVPAGDLYGTHTVGQTFVANQVGLSGVEVMVVHYGPESDRPAVPLELRLCQDLTCQVVITGTTIPAEALSHNQPYRLRCSPQQDSAGRTYVLLAAAPQASAPAQTTLWAHSSDLYTEGELLRDGQPVAGDLNFWVYYEADAGQVARELLQLAGEGLRYLPALLGLLLAPGYLLLRLLPRSREDDPVTLVGTCLSLSVAVVPVALLLFSQLGVPLGGWAIALGGILLSVLALGLLVWDVVRGRWRGEGAKAPLVVVVVVGIVAISLWLRAFHALGLVGPLWVDAVHHSLLARMIVEQGAIPGSYLPFIDVSPATYHFGFQGLVATLHGLSGMAIPSALLLLGQTLSALAGLPLYVLGKRWGRSAWAGLAALLVPSAISLMPAYYISWSRYTEMVGLFILPVAVVLLERLMRAPRLHWGLAGVSALALAGLVVTHLRVAAFLAALIGLLLLGMTIRRRYDWRAMGRPWVRLLGVTVVAVALIGSWLWPSIRHLWIPAARQWPVAEEPLSLQYILSGLGQYVVPLAVAGTVVRLLWRRWEALLLFLWVGLVIVMANPGFVGLQPGGPLERAFPGLHVGAVVDDTAVAIALYVPLGLAAALACGGLAVLARRMHWGRRWWRWAGAVLFIGLAGWGSYELRGIVNSRTAILARSDVEAMSWIEENTDPEALFLINSYQWMTGVHAGTDGGYWISPLAGRRTWPPPALYGLGSDDYVAHVNQVASEAMDSPDGEALYALLRQHGFTHVYLGRYGGPLTAEELLGWPNLFRPVYQQDGVWIFALEP